jgi:hypothetical protein
MAEISQSPPGMSTMIRITLTCRRCTTKETIKKQSTNSKSHAKKKSETVLAPKPVLTSIHTKSWQASKFEIVRNKRKTSSTTTRMHAKRKPAALCVGIAEGGARTLDLEVGNI